MSDKSKIAKEILERYRLGQSTEQERRLVEDWMDEYANMDPSVDQAEMNSRLDATWRKLHAERSKRRRRLLRITGVAASVALILGVWLLQRPVSSEDALPGSNSAQLDLSLSSKEQLGTTIRVSNGKEYTIDQISSAGEPLASGIVLKKNADGSLEFDTRNAKDKDLSKYINSISTPRGEQLKVVLSDGSLVWLNAESQIQFPAIFASDLREVSLSGEAYFEVEKDPRRPFFVNSKGQQIQVKGTKFNVKAYPEEAVTTTTLLSGSVDVLRRTGEKEEVIALVPNEQLRSSARSMKKLKVQSSNVIAWTNGKFIFDDTPLHVILTDLARWYDVEIDSKELVRGVTFKGTLNKNEPIESILRKISLTESVNLTLKGRRIMVTQ